MVPPPPGVAAVTGRRGRRQGLPLGGSSLPTLLEGWLGWPEPQAPFQAGRVAGFSYVTPAVLNSYAGVQTPALSMGLRWNRVLTEVM